MFPYFDYSATLKKKYYYGIKLPLDILKLLKWSIPWCKAAVAIHDEFKIMDEKDYALNITL